MHPQEPIPVKYIFGVLYSDETQLAKARHILEQTYGPFDYKTEKYPFEITDYYEPEMGSPIYRLFYSLKQPANPNLLARIKIECNDIEEALAVSGNRTVNIDPGYMDYDKFILASAKYNAQKVYMDYGIWADVTLYYRKGHFDPSVWCFPDFKDGRYEDAFLHIRAKYKGQLRKMMKM